MAERHEVSHDDPRTLAEAAHNVGAAASESADAILRFYLSVPDPNAPELGPGDDGESD